MHALLLVGPCLWKKHFNFSQFFFHYVCNLSLQSLLEFNKLLLLLSEYNNLYEVDQLAIYVAWRRINSGLSGTKLVTNLGALHSTENSRLNFGKFFKWQIEQHLPEFL